MYQGEFGRMMKKSGCYIRNDFYFQNDTAKNGIFLKSAIECANKCHDSDCEFGWRYQLATKKCVFMQNVTLSKLKPDMEFSTNYQTIGWASGYKSCSQPGKIF